MFVAIDGVAGTLEGELAVSVPDLDSGVLVLRFNNTGSAVNKEIQVGLDKFKILFGESEGSIFAASISGLTLNIGDSND